MDGVRSRALGNLTPAQTLADVVDVFRAAREWSVDIDEQLRTEGHEPGTATFGVPVAQLDTMIIILDRTHDAMQEALVALATAERTLATAQRHRRFALGYALGCGLLTLVNVVCVIVWWV